MPKHRGILSTALSSYRQARWPAVILYGLAGSGKTALARVLADNVRVGRAFRDGILWADGSRNPKKETRRLCVALGLARAGRTLAALGGRAGVPLPADH